MNKINTFIFLVPTRGRSNHACHYLRDVVDVGLPLVRPVRPGQQSARPGGLQPMGTGQQVARSGHQSVGSGEAAHRLLLVRLENKMAALKSDQVSRG